MAKLNKKIYTKRANILRKLGYNVTFRGDKGKASSKEVQYQKRAISRIWNTSQVKSLDGRHLAPSIGDATKTNSKYTFQKIKKSNRESLRKLFPQATFTPKGIFLPVPIDPRTGDKTKGYRVKFDKKNRVIIDSGKNTYDIFIQLDRAELAADPLGLKNKILEKYKKNFLYAVILVNGFTSSQITTIDFGQMENYISSLSDEIKKHENNKTAPNYVLKITLKKGVK